MKALGLVVSDKKIFENCILETYFWPRDLHMQPVRTIWTILVGDHPGTIPVEFGQITISSSRDVVWTFPYIIQCKIVTNQNHLNNFGRGPPRDHSCEVWSKSNKWFQRRRCLSKQEGPEGPGCSPEEKVKGHSGANKREPRGHNLNNFGRGPLDDAIYQIWKHWAL